MAVQISLQKPGVPRFFVFLIDLILSFCGVRRDDKRKITWGPRSSRGMTGVGVFVLIFFSKILFVIISGLLNSYLHKIYISLGKKIVIPWLDHGMTKRYNLGPVVEPRYGRLKKIP